jgi:hypothetical protein
MGKPSPAVGGLGATKLKTMKSLKKMKVAKSLRLTRLNCLRKKNDFYQVFGVLAFGQ